MGKTNRSRIRVSDHAIIRYLERHYGVDVEKIREEIVEICKGPVAAGAKNFLAQGVAFAFEPHTLDPSIVVVATVLDPDTKLGKYSEALHAKRKS